VHEARRFVGGVGASIRRCIVAAHAAMAQASTTAAMLFNAPAASDCSSV